MLEELILTDLLDNLQVNIDYQELQKIEDQENKNK